ncbi:MAG: cytochrome P460 family protein [Armatimonadota bacterium]
MVSVRRGVYLIAGVTLAVAGIASGGRGPTTLELVKGFHGWKKVNPKPVRLASKFNLLCAPASMAMIKAEQKMNPHFQRVITVYVNKVGEKAMEKGGKFPVGSVIVKEKLEESFKTPVLSTVMIKREKGYNPKCGDWQFAVIDAFTTKVTVDGKLESCMFCHQDQAKKDFVFKTYVGAKGRMSSGG